MSADICIARGGMCMLIGFVASITYHRLSLCKCVPSYDAKSNLNELIECAVALVFAAISEHSAEMLDFLLPS